MLTRRPLVALATLMLVPATLAAQPRRARTEAPPAGRPGFGVSPTELLDLRRELDLTPRQVARLDSLERSVVTRRRTLMTQARAMRDSACGRGGRCDLSDSAQRSLRDRMAQLRARQVDTTVGRRALAVLDSTQRGRVQGMRMGRERQGMAMRRDGMGRRGSEFAPRRGPGRDRRDAGPRPPGGGRSEERWMPRGGGRDAPVWRNRDDDRGPRRPLPPMRRRGGDLDTIERPDSTR